MTVDEIIDKMRKQASEDEYTPDGILGQTLNYLADELEKAIQELRARYSGALLDAYTKPIKRNPKQNHERFTDLNSAINCFCREKGGITIGDREGMDWFAEWLYEKPMPIVVKAKRDTSREDFLSALNDLTEKADAEEMSSIADALSEDLENSGIEFDTENCTCDPKESFDMPGFFVGLDALPGGTPIMWFGAGGDWEQPIAFCIYVGVDNKIHAYVPREGNCFNKETNAAFGNAPGMNWQEEMEQLKVEYKFDMKKMREEASKALE